ncbi:unnamed protein product [Miscanthus lutarioriparius]|uniref:Uncharacterized protein n=1 Tax=Miscanthus lutarioriparius TaxID=422564 RepID=A0A811MMG4_9POAL|nr:unnamed protein product [Miscanthus lutarioriparius]
MAKQQHQQAVCMVFLMAFIVLSAMHAVPVEAGRALREASSIPKFDPLDPNSVPSVPAGEPYTRPGCTNVYNCHGAP